MFYSHSARRSLVFMTLLTLLAACSTTDTRPPVVPEPQAPVGAEATPTPPAEGIASETLRSEAMDAAKQGHFERALALLERAHRLDPDEPGIYLELARVHRRLGDNDMAKATAERGLLYCSEARMCDRLRGYIGES